MNSTRPKTCCPLNNGLAPGLGARRPDLAERVAAKIAGREGLEPPLWRALTPGEYGLFEREFGLAQEAEPDIPPEYAHDDLLRTAYELGGRSRDGRAEQYPAAQAMEETGCPPMVLTPIRHAAFLRCSTNTAY
jgi:hypothetical protein